MIKKLINSIITIMMVVMLIHSFTYTSYGSDTIDSVIQGARDFVNVGNDMTYNIGNSQVTALSESKLKNVSDFLFNLLLSIAMVVAVIVGMILGIKFMMSSIEEKAKIKETLVPYVISCIVIFGAFGIWKLLVMILSEW